MNNAPLTYGQCLRRIMQRNQLTIHTLSKKMGYRSPTQLTRILADEVSPDLITRFHHQFMLIFDWLISPAEIKELSASLQYSCLGPETYITRRAMYQMLLDPPRLSADHISLRIFPPLPVPCPALADLFALARAHRQIDLLLVGSAIDEWLPLFADMLGGPAQNLRIRHYFVMEENAAQLVARVSALTPFLNTNAYSGAYCTQSSPEACSFLQKNPIALARSVTANGETLTSVLAPLGDGGLGVCRLEGDALYAFYDNMMKRFSDQLRPIKSAYPQPDSIESLLTLCQRDLFLEQRRACCFVRLDLCFHALPEPVVLAALDNGARLGLSPDDALMADLRQVHRERYQNLVSKREATYFVLSRPAMLAFARTGRLSDHLFAMRDFTPGERAEILRAFLAACRENPNLHVHLLADDALAPSGCFSCYEEMGVQISANDTAYNPADSHSEVFVGLPAFAESFQTYCVNTLIPEYCMDERASLDCLNAMLEEVNSAPEA